jgi:hypothetical protein
MFRLYGLLLSQAELQKQPLRLVCHQGLQQCLQEYRYFCLKNSIFRYFRYQNNT